MANVRTIQHCQSFALVLFGEEIFLFMWPADCYIRTNKGTIRIRSYGGTNWCGDERRQFTLPSLCHRQYPF